MKESPTAALAVVGASARAAAFSAIRSGLLPLTADLFADADLAQCAPAVRVERYPRGLLDWLGTTPENTFWMYTGALENYPDLIDEMSAVRQLVGCRGDVLRRIRDPHWLAMLLSEVGAAFPETKTSLSPLLLDGERAGGGREGERAPPNAANTTDASAWLLKTYRGSSGSGVRNWDGTPPPDVSASLVLQKRIDGTPGAAVFVAGGGQATLLGVTRQLVGTAWTHAGAFQYAGSIGPWCLDDAAEAELQRAGNAVAEAGVAGLFGLDFVLSDKDGRPYVVEVNPRYTASVEIVERLSGVSAIAMHLRARLRGGASPPPPAPPPSRGRGATNVSAASRGRGEFTMTLGKAIFFAPQDVTVTQAFADWTRAKTTGPPWPELADLPHAGTTIPAGRPVLTVFAQGTSHAEVERMLQARMEEMEQRLVRPHRSRVGGAPVCKPEQATAKNPPPPTSRRWSE